MKQQRKRQSQTSIDETLKSLVMESVEEATVLSNAGMELKLQLPMSASSKFAPLLHKLDNEIVNGRTISSYGLSFTSLEEVFLLVARGDGTGIENESDQKALIKKSLKVNESVGKSQMLPPKDFSSENLFFAHVQALFLKRFLGFKRDKKAWIFTTILPSSFVFLGFVLVDSLTTYAMWFLIVL